MKEILEGDYVSVVLIKPEDVGLLKGKIFSINNIFLQLKTDENKPTYYLIPITNIAFIYKN